MNFNPRTPVGCDEADARSHRWPADFNPRTPVGCDPATEINRLWPQLFQSTHPSGVRPPVSAELRVLDISIHAPQWGATGGFSVGLGVVCLFQSTHPSGVRPHSGPSMEKPHTISIHAPQWGATWSYYRRTGGRRYFNPRTPVGCDYRRKAPSPS